MIRVAIVDQQAVLRMGVRQLLSTHDDMDLVAEAANGRTALDALRGHDLDVLLLDLAMSGPDGLDALLSVKARRPNLPVLVFSALPEERYATTALRQGASGYLSKDADPDALVQAIRWVHQGHRFMTPQVADLLADEWASPSNEPAHAQLSDREMQVFLGLARGETLSAVAGRMCLSVKTVSTYRSRLVAKLQVTTNSELTYYAMKHGLID